jgi:hypothetical protein
MKNTLIELHDIDLTSLIEKIEQHKQLLTEKNLHEEQQKTLLDKKSTLLGQAPELLEKRNNILKERSELQKRWQAILETKLKNGEQEDQLLRKDQDFFTQKNIFLENDTILLKKGIDLLKEENQLLENVNKMFGLIPYTHEDFNTKLSTINQISKSTTPSVISFSPEDFDMWVKNDIQTLERQLGLEQTKNLLDSLNEIPQKISEMKLEENTEQSVMLQKIFDEGVKPIFEQFLDPFIEKQLNSIFSELLKEQQEQIEKARKEGGFFNFKFMSVSELQNLDKDNVYLKVHLEKICKAEQEKQKANIQKIDQDLINLAKHTKDFSDYKEKFSQYQSKGVDCSKEIKKLDSMLKEIEVRVTFLKTSKEEFVSRLKKTALSEKKPTQPQISLGDVSFLTTLNPAPQKEPEIITPAPEQKYPRKMQ